MIQNKLQMIREQYNCENITEYYVTKRLGHTIYDIRKCLLELYNDDSDRDFCQGFADRTIDWHDSDFEPDESDSDLDDSDSDLDD